MEETDGFEFDFAGFREASRSKFIERTSFWSFVRDFLDPTFQRYVTPTIIMITWWVVMASAALSLALMLFSAVMYIVGAEPTPDDGMRPQFNRPVTEGVGTPAVLWRLVSAPIITAFSIVLTFLGVLWVRVVLEVFIVVFHISNTLKLIYAKVSA